LQFEDFDMIKQASIDPMHNVYMGVVGKLLRIFFVGRKNTGGILSRTVTEKITNIICDLKGKLPAEFHRNLRPLHQIKKYKAKEMRMFVQYIGINVLFNNLEQTQYKNFLKLHCAVKILSDEELSKLSAYRELANSLLKQFTIEFENLYGQENMTINMHLITHMAKEVELNGPLDDFSNFKFENYLGYLKKLVNSPFKPLQQIEGRICEIYQYSLLQKDETGIKYNNASQSININGVLISTRFPNSIVSLKTSEILKITKIEEQNECFYLTGCVLNTNEYFSDPIKSSTIGCFIADKESSQMKRIKSQQMKRKMVAFEYNELSFLVIPMTHNLSM
jgi:Domain of unknown function (DUF4218)